MIDWDKLVNGPVNGVFGELVQYQPAGGAPFTINGVFNEAYRGVSLAGGMDVASAAPVLGVQLSQFPVPPAQGDELVILRTGELFTVRNPEPNGHGAALLHLNFTGSDYV